MDWRPAINNLGVYPRPVQNPLPIWIGSGGNTDSTICTGLLGLPLMLAIIGGRPVQLVQLYKKAAAQVGYDLSQLACL